MKIVLGSDHGGFRLKEILRSFLAARGVEAQDAGCFREESVDYPDFARAVAERVQSGAADQGLLVCTTGVGMSIAANRFPGIRAAICVSPYMARMARTHNDANVLVLGGQVVSDDEARAILEEWLRHGRDNAARHRRRLAKVERYGERAAETARLGSEDPETAAAIREEIAREERTINLIASENYASRAVREAQGSVLTNKYAEGYPGKRWYHGCKPADDVERLAIERAQTLFGAEHANVQPHCGSSANMAAYFALLEPGDTIVAMSLAHGGHLTHGHRANFSGRFYRVVSYGVDAKTERVDYAELARLVREHRPKVVVAGASAYPRILDFAKFREIADLAGARLVVDMAHIAGLVAGRAHPSPVPFAEVVTSTTHKTLRGPRSGMILCRRTFAEEIDRQVFPGIQGGPLMHAVAAKAVCFREASRPEFGAYALQTVRNAAALAEALAAGGLRLVSGGTENHLLLVDVTPLGITGRDAASALDRAGIVVNKNAIPFDTKSAAVTSGIRIGTPAVTTRGMREDEMRVLASHIVRALRSPGDEAGLAAVASAVEEMALQFPPP